MEQEQKDKNWDDDLLYRSTTGMIKNGISEPPISFRLPDRIVWAIDSDSPGLVVNMKQEFCGDA